jgi:hypothetical protein
MSFLKPWKYFSLKSLCAGTCESLLTSASLTESKDGGRHSECAVFFIVISYSSVSIPCISNTTRPATHPPPPASKILQTICYKFHPLTQYRVDIRWRVLVAYRRQEEHETSAWAEEIPRKKNEIGDELGKLVGLSWGYVRFISNSKFSSELKEYRRPRTYGRGMAGWSRSSRIFLRPRRFAPARTPSAIGHC